MKDVRISDHGNWRHVHWNAFVAAYKQSPFFDYYADEFHRFLSRNTNFCSISIWNYATGFVSR